MSLKPQLTADGSQTLFSERYTQTFHSDKGAVSETKHIFLDKTGVRERLKARQFTKIIEVGFGTGLNFFLSADLALQNNCALHFVSLEQMLLPASVLESLKYQAYLVHPELLKAYLEYRNTLGQTPPQSTYIFEFEGVRLELLLGEATEQTLPETYFDACYQDAFSPDANSELWSSDFLAKLYAALKPKGVLTTYSVKGDVRRSLSSLGFKVEKCPGPVGGKREMLRAVRHT